MEPQQISPSVAFTLQDADSCPSWCGCSAQLPEASITTSLGHHLQTPWSLHAPGDPSVPALCPWPAATVCLY